MLLACVVAYLTVLGCTSRVLDVQRGRDLLGREPPLGVDR